MIMCTSPEELDRAKKIKEEYPFFKIAFGWFPSDAKEIADKEIQYLIPDTFPIDFINHFKFGNIELNHGILLIRISRNQFPSLLEVGGRKYQLHGNIIRSANNDESSAFMGITYWVDVTDYDNIRLEYERSRPVAAVIVIDNLDELTKNQPDRIKNDIRDAVEDKLNQWCEENGCYAENARNFNLELRKFGEVVRRRPKAGGEKTTLLIGYRLKDDFLMPPNE